jgi:hypothetical protein
VTEADHSDTPSQRGVILWRWSLIFCLALYGALLVRASSSIAGGADSSGYLNAARLFSRGRAVERIQALERWQFPVQWAGRFIPLGFSPSVRPGSMAPSYPPGLPLHMAAAAAVGGWARAPFLVPPAAAMACLVLLYLLGRELSLSRTLSAAAAILLAACPIFFGMAIQPMSDVPATLWILAALLAGLRARRRESWAILCGIAFGIAVLVRPTDLLAAPAVALALPAKKSPIWKAGLAALPIGALLAIYNTAAFGSPTATGYGLMLSSALSASNVWPAIRNYGHWLLILLTPLLPLAWLAVSVDRRVSARDRALLLLWFGAFLVFYSFYEVYEDWWSVRFLLPAIPAMILAACLLARDIPATFQDRSLLGRRFRMKDLIGAALLGSILVVDVVHIRRFDLLGMARGEAVYRDASLWAASTLPADSLVASMQMSGALKYYTNVPIVRWDLVDAARFQDFRQTVESRGVRWYALLWPFEEAEFQKRLPGRWTRIGASRDIGLWRLD